MGVERWKLNAVVLRTVDYGESDRVVTLLSRERGKVSAFARGARASRRRFGGALEPFTLLAAEVRSRSGSELLGLETVAVLRGYGGIRGDLARIACAAYAAEVARELVRDHEPHDDLFELLVEYLELARRGPGPPGIAARLRAGRAGGGGAGPAARRVRPLRRRARSVGAERPVRSRPRRRPVHGVLGGVAGRSAAPLASRSRWPWARLQAGGLPASLAEPLPPPAGRELREALGAFLAHHLGRTLAARRFLDEVGPVLDG